MRKYQKHLTFVNLGLVKATPHHQNLPVQSTEIFKVVKNVNFSVEFIFTFFLFLLKT